MLQIELTTGELNRVVTRDVCREMQRGETRSAARKRKLSSSQHPFRGRARRDETSAFGGFRHQI